MRISLSILGLEIFDFEFVTDQGDADEEPRTADQTGGWLGFNPTPGDQRWERCADFGEDDEE